MHTHAPQDWKKLTDEIGAENMPVRFGRGGQSSECCDRFWGHSYESMATHHEARRTREAGSS